jgi:drug/metabolite transporter (DMT)-like permease
MVQSQLSLDCNFAAPMFSLLSCMLPLCIIFLGLMIWGEYGPSSSSAEVTTDLSVPAEGGDNAESNGDISHHTTSQKKQFSFFGLIPLQTSLRMYAAIAMIDVYASYFTILAFRYTTITSVVLFDALAIHSAMVVSRCFFQRRYASGHFLGVFVCTVGMILNVAVDYEEDKEGRSFFVGKDNAQQQLIQEEYPHKVRGDILAILGGILFGVANTLQEVAVKDGSVIEYLGCFAFFASIITFTQAMIFERTAIIDFFSQTSSETCAESEGDSLFLLFAIAGLVKYVGNGYFLQISDATFFNLR